VLTTPLMWGSHARVVAALQSLTRRKDISRGPRNLLITLKHKNR